jgi:hypothetical protein
MLLNGFVSPAHWEYLESCERRMQDTYLLEAMNKLFDELWTAIRKKRAEGVDVKFPKRGCDEAVPNGVHLLMGYVITRGKGIGVVEWNEQYWEDRRKLYAGMMEKWIGFDMFRWAEEYEGIWWHDLVHQLRRFFPPYSDAMNDWWREYSPRSTSHLRTMPPRAGNHRYHNRYNRRAGRDFRHLID